MGNSGGSCIAGFDGENHDHYNEQKRFPMTTSMWSADKDMS